MKKILTFILALVACIGTMFAESGTCGDNLTWDLTDGVLTISGTGAMTEYAKVSDVPWYDYIGQITKVVFKEGSNITSIGNRAFVYCSSLTSIEIPNSVITIGESAFYGCTGLISVTIPNSVTTIGLAAFYQCSSLKEVTIPESVTNIGDYVFCGCTSLTFVTIPNSVTSIGYAAFYQCSSLKEVTIPESVTNIGDYVFCGCTSLTFVTIPNSVTSIGYAAFYQCSSLTSVTIGSSVTTIADYAFSECSSLTRVILNSNTIVGKTYSYDSSLKNIFGVQVAEYIIGNDVTNIGMDAFRGCSGLTAITISSSVTNIGDYAFSECDGLTSMVVENGNTKYDSRNNCNAIIETSTNTLIAGCKNTIIPNSVTIIGKNAFYECYSLTSIEIPNSVTSIGKNAFQECYSLTSIEIPNSVTSIGTWAFFEVPNIVYYGTATGSPWGARSANGYVDGWLIYSNDTKTNLLACSSAATGIIEIPNSVTSIGKGAFDRCTRLTSIEIPNSVTSIGKNAFQECYSLTSIEIPNSVTSIGTWAFNMCFSLRSVTIPSSVTCIDNNVFRDCHSLTSIEIPNSVTSIGNYAFIRCPLTSIEIPNSVTSIGEGTFYGCTSLTSVTIPNSITNIAVSTFEGCTKLQRITNYAKKTQILADTLYVFKDVDLSSVVLYVPQSAVEAYKNAAIWQDFGQILPIAEEEDVEQITFIPESNTADVAWPKVTNAASYELIIRDSNGELVDSLVFDADGRLLTQISLAPASGDAPQKIQTAGFAFTITGLESNTTYYYILTTKNENGTILDTQSGTFITSSPQGIEDIEAITPSTKFLKDGRIYILRGEKAYTIQGQEVNLTYGR